MKDQILYYLAQQSSDQPVIKSTEKTSTTEKLVAPAPGAQKPKGIFEQYSMFIIFGVVFVGMYFLMIRPQKKEEKRKKELLSTLKKGDQVVTNSGIIGTVSSVKEETVFINVGDGTRLEFLRSAIGDVRNNKDEKVPAKAGKS